MKFPVSKLGLLFALPFVALVISQETSSLMPGAFPWQRLFLPVLSAMYGLSGTRSAAPFNFFIAVCTVTNALIAYAAGSCVARRKFSLAGIAFGGAYIAAWFGGWVYVARVARTANMAGLLLVMLAEPWEIPLARLGRSTGYFGSASILIGNDPEHMLSIWVRNFGWRFWRPGAASVADEEGLMPRRKPGRTSGCCVRRRELASCWRARRRAESFGFVELFR